MPAEAHGEEHEVALVVLIPARSSPRRGQHKPDLVTDGKREIGHQHQSSCSTSFLTSPLVFSQAAAADDGLGAQ